MAYIWPNDSREAAGLKRGSRDLPPEMKIVSHAELAKHSSDGDVWMAVHGLVYDVTTFMPQHPGGHEVGANYL
jgi:cytochrome b involved in lipid metabolism